MQLAKFIEQWAQILSMPGVDKYEAARQAATELSDQEAYLLVPIVSPLDHQVSMTTSVHRNLPDHARSALRWWLERTDGSELIRLGDADRSRSLRLISRPVDSEIADQGMLRRYLSGDEWQNYWKLHRDTSDSAKAICHNLEEIARLRHELSKLLGVTTE